ncbi:16S rRNA (adenine(1518)-N(6)/adenine(1519)-N(6))-dimethyltransferase RsmA [Arenibacter sp. TNZ]|jgi:16S rRNA (adenine1518-N6/adenine1519-N6)-dimethyltransferase|uniref:16S rRNA (adenine(1518)-N(6)/adenine(1519)-N(6))- dimethyltransferase RsmA n=1 Tax=Arenibacter TaxID=178469 RepID=UPI000CD3E5DA|nr:MULTISPECIES: 16S rRNA (adenine(1518)-N(6)/adenine(1519)-N(6))-dimethyltransferase RsmA [Arenibacter]MCM4173613.1 16S rRNA (adenine(1518)-N(6)/adenine(1519)-N(6))-dimethyltransferase RsmA [Arenibacter sp. TNZ]
MSKKGKKPFHSKKEKFNRPWKEESPVKAKKHLGQHFLKDETVAQQIGDTLTLNGYRNVIEIGPGTGVLTKYLLEKDIDLVAMDLDADSIIYLNHSFPLEHNKVMQRTGEFKVLEADFLKYDLWTLFGEEQFAITGNFPYNISTQIVFKMLEFKDQVPEFTGMFQKEVAERICEKEGSKAYGILSVLVQAFYDAEYLFTVSPEVFDPPPKVQSGVLRLIRKSNFHLEVDERLFKQVVKAVFNQRRKTIRNSLKTFNLSDVLKEDAIFGLRPEQLTVADFISLTQKIANDTI